MDRMLNDRATITLNSIENLGFPSYLMITPIVAQKINSAISPLFLTLTNLRPMNHRLLKELPIFVHFKYLMKKQLPKPSTE